MQPDAPGAQEHPVPDEEPVSSGSPSSPTEAPVPSAGPGETPESSASPGQTDREAAGTDLPEPDRHDVGAGETAGVSGGQDPETATSSTEKTRSEETTAPEPEAPTSGMSPLLIAGGAILILLLVLAGAFLLPGMLPQDHGPVIPAPASVPTATPAQVPAPTPDIIPQEGVWVRIVTTGFFTGQAGNPGSLQDVAGSGEKFFKVRDSTGQVKVSVQKQENTGDELLVEIYRNGTEIASRSVTAPKGSIDLLIDPFTGNPPGLPATTPAVNTTGSSGQLVYL
jgi:hypothetical protein